MSIERLMEVQQRIAELNEIGIVTDVLDELRAERGRLEMNLMTLKVSPTMETPIAWDILLAYRMVRQRNHALIDRQRSLQNEQINLSKQLGLLRTRIDKLADAIAIVEKAGGEAHSLRAQIGTAHAEVQRIEPRHAYLEKATSLLAANLRLIEQAHGALHWLNFENNNLADFDKLPEVPKLESDLSKVLTHST